MRGKKKVDKAVAGLMAFLESQGVDTTNVKVDESVTDVRWHRSLEAEGVLLSLDSDKLQFITKVCKQCEELFATNYRAVGYCTDACRKRALAKIGVNWDPTKSAQQRWGWNENMPSQVPMVMSQQAIEVLERLLERAQESRIQREIELRDQARLLQIQNETPEERELRLEKERRNQVMDQITQEVYGPVIEEQLKWDIESPTAELEWKEFHVVLPSSAESHPESNSDDTSPQELPADDNSQPIPVEFDSSLFQ